MARQAKSETQTIVQYFQSAPLAVAETLLDVVKGVVAGRKPTPAPVTKKAPKSPKPTKNQFPVDEYANQPVVSAE